MSRLSKEQYGMLLAIVAKERSEDQFLKVGAVVENSEGRIIATGYNGLPAGFTLPEEISKDRDARRPFIIHAEINALALTKRGEGVKLYSSLHPCASCINAAIAHGIKEVVYYDEWENVTADILTLVKSRVIEIRKFVGKLEYKI